MPKFVVTYRVCVPVHAIAIIDADNITHAHAIAEARTPPPASAFSFVTANMDAHKVERAVDDPAEYASWKAIMRLMTNNG